MKYNWDGMRTFIIFSLFSLLLTGCVGTVQDTSQAISKVNTPPVIPMNFTGITNAIAISDTRVEVYFYPAAGGSGNYTYDIFVGSSPTPVSIPSDVLVPDYRGLLRATVTNLSRLASYQIKVDVRDTTLGTSSATTNYKTVMTFSDEVADFDGISSVSNTSGQDGKDSIKVRWTPARTSGGLIKQAWDPKAYELVLVDAEKLTPGDMDLPYTNAQGKWVFQLNHDNMINEYVARGLPAKTRFYARIRALHMGSVDDVYDPKKRSELNNKYLSISTLSADLADINFTSDSFGLALASGEQGLNAIVASWVAATGVFDHFRLYYSEEGGGVADGNFPDLCLSPLQSVSGTTVFCKKAKFSAISEPITGLIPYRNYEVALVLCQTAACGPSERIVSPTRTITTDPNFPLFNGLRSIDIATNLDDLGSIFLNFDTPSFLNGYFDGLVVKMRRTLNGTDVPVEITETGTPYSVPFDFLSQNKIQIVGIDYLAQDPYCFTIYPYKWDADGITKRESPNDIWRCVQLKVEAPTATEFPGLKTATAYQNVVTLTWEPPTKGIFSHYEVYWRKGSHIFTWGDAITQAGTSYNYTNYGRALISNTLNEYQIDNLANGNYALGVITYYSYVTNDGSVILRSETNPSILKCVVNSTAPSPVECSY